MKHFKKRVKDHLSSTPWLYEDLEKAKTRKDVELVIESHKIYHSTFVDDAKYLIRKLKNMYSIGKRKKRK